MHFMLIICHTLDWTVHHRQIGHDSWIFVVVKSRANHLNFTVIYFKPCTRAFNMGGGESKHEESKTVDAAGAINNNLVFSQPVPIHHKMLEWLILIICIVKVIELAITLYKIHQKNLKKKYTGNPA